MDKEAVLRCIDWLDPALNPRIVMGNKEELERLRVQVSRLRLGNPK